MRLDICTLIACTCGLTTSQIALADDPPADVPAPTCGAPPQPAPAPPPEPATPPPPAPVSEAPMPPPSYEAPAEHPGPYSYAWSDPRLYSGIGIGFALGGGVSGFTDSGMTDISSSDVAGLWSFRTSFGTHIPLGAEVAYVGTAADVDTFSGIPNGTLIGTTIEATARWNILPHFWFNPYLFGGIGWSHYDLTDAQFETADSGILDSDDFVEVPMGAGFSMRDVSGFMFDVRGTFRAAGSSDLVVDNDGDAADLHTWEANASLGYEF